MLKLCYCFSISYFNMGNCSFFFSEDQLAYASTPAS
jgi:hypothetical protein